MSKIRHGLGALAALGAAAAATAFTLTTDAADNQWVQPVQDVTPPPGPVTLTCAGEPIDTMGGLTEGSVEQVTEGQPGLVMLAAAIGEGAGDSERFLTVEFGPAGGDPAGEADAVETITTLDSYSAISEPRTMTGSLIASASDESPVALSATTTWLQESGERAGLAATPCIVPANSHWLVGGTTEIGSSTRLVLTNPSSTAATVSIDVYTSQGRSADDFVPTVTLAPGQVRDVLLEASVTDPRVAVHVTSTGALIGAHLQTHEVSGFIGRGIELIGPGDTAAPTQLIPGVDLTASGEPTLRLVNPHDTPITASVDLLLPDADRALPGAEELELSPGSVLDVSLVSQESGLGSVRVTAEESLVAGVRWGTENDFAWAGSVRPAPSGHMSIPTGTQSVVVTATATTDVQLEWINAHGGVVVTDDFDLAANSTFAVPLPDGAVAARFTASEAVALGAPISAPEQGYVSWLPQTSDPSESASHSLSLRN